jgi:hypothetical protein
MGVNCICINCVYFCDLRSLHDPCPASERQVHPELRRFHRDNA